MSWIQWQGEVWPATDNEASLSIYLWPADCGYPRAAWRLTLSHYHHPPDVPKEDYSQDRYLTLTLPDLFFHEPDWRRLGRHEIRATPDWHDRHEHFTRHHQLVEAKIEAGVEEPGAPGDSSPIGNLRWWNGHEFTLRFGERDGLGFSCELDAWLLPQETYALPSPEPAANRAPFASTPPTLRVIARAIFRGGQVTVGRDGGADPVAAARAELRAGITYEGELYDPKIAWALRRSADAKKIEAVPGRASTVSFSTSPSEG